jgi:hypothetical protein
MPTPDEDDMPTPDEDDMPTPDEDDMPTPDEDDMPTPDEDDMPTPDEDDMPTPDEDDMPTPDEDDVMPTPDEDDEVTPTPDEQDIIDAFEYADMMDDGELEAYELEMVWLAYCESELNESCWGEGADSECCTRDTAAIIEMFDEDNSGTMCLDEFANFFNQVNDETIVWPEEDEDDDMPTPDEDDMPTPDEDDMPTPDEDDMPTPDEDDMPTPDEDDEDDEVTPTPDEDGTDDEDEIDNNDNAVTSQEDFDNWAWTRDVPENDVLNCGFDIRNEWHNGYYLWAGQNCEIYDLWVRIYVPQDAWENRKVWETSDMTCIEENCDGDECNALFKITPANPRLGIAFDGQGEEVNFRFETERWAPCVDEMTV